MFGAGMNKPPKGSLVAPLPTNQNAEADVEPISMVG
jgi:hypothetical protein